MTQLSNFINAMRGESAIFLPKSLPGKEIKIFLSSKISAPGYCAGEMSRSNRNDGTIAFITNYDEIP
jgi:hypothetical protein